MDAPPPRSDMRAGMLHSNRARRDRRSALWICAVGAALSLAATGCYRELPYTPQPQLVKNPAADFDRLVKLHWPNHPVRVNIGNGYAQLSWIDRPYGEQHVEAKVVDFKKLRRTHIGEVAGRWLVGGFDDEDNLQFSMMVDSPETAKEVADVLAALGGASARR